MQPVHISTTFHEHSLPALRVGQMSGNSASPLAPGTDIGSSQFHLLLQDALIDFSRRTKVDLFTDPSTKALMRCDSVDEVMSILQDRIDKTNDFRGGDIKIQLVSKLMPFVTTVLALNPIETIGEGFGANFAPAKVIVGAAGVLLEAVKGVSSSYNSLMELLDCITRFLVRLEIYTKVPLNPAMKSTLVRTLVHVISVLALATEQIKQGRLVAYVRKLMGNNDVEDALRKMERLNVEEAQMTGVETLRLVHYFMNSLIETMTNGGHIPTDSIRESLDRLEDYMADMRQDITKLHREKSVIQQCRIWLSPPDPSTNHNMALSHYHQNSGRWLIESEQVRQWKTSTSLLWIHGKPGSGKTVICSAIIEDIKRICRVQPKSVLAYFYCDFRDSAKQRIHGLLSYLILCISTKTRLDCCTSILNDLYTKNDIGGQQPTEFELIECLKKMLKQAVDYSLYIIVDALDECPASGVFSPRRQILDLITRIMGWRISNIHICLTSRPEPDIKDALGRLSPLTISLHEESGQAHDIAAYVRYIMESNPRFGHWRAEDKALAVQVLSEKADGMFRWAQCQLDALHDCPHLSAQDVLKNLPTTLDETYQRMLRNLNPDLECTRRLFQFLVACSRPLRISELAELLVMDFVSTALPEVREDRRLPDPERTLSSLCSSMILVDSKTRAVQFAHYSVQEYLTSERLRKDNDCSHFYIETGHAHATLAAACLSTLLQFSRPTDDIPHRTSQFPLAEYSAPHWISHVAQARDVPTHVQDAMKCIFDPHKQHLAAAMQICRFIDSVTYDTIDRLCLAAQFGCYDMVEYLLVTHRMKTKARSRHGPTPLQVASANGHSEVARLLIKYRAEVNARGHMYGSALRTASLNGHLEVARLLIKHRADVNAEGGRFGSALYAASSNGHLKVAHLLIEHGARVNTNGKHIPALCAASGNGHLDVARLLIERGAHVNAKGDECDSALYAASWNGHLQVARMLIEHGANINAKGGEYGSALCAASWNGHLGVARLLIENGADVNAEGGENGSALCVASENGFLGITRLLLEHGADVNTEGGRYGSALCAASFWGQLKLVRLLIEHGANINAEGSKYSPALCAASENGHLEVAHLLIKHGADINAKGDGEGPVLCAVSGRGLLDSARLLIRHGADVNAEGGEDGPPLYVAAWNGHLKAVRLLIQHGANVNKEGGEYGSALCAASENGFLDIARLLIEHGADVNKEGGEYGSALCAASQNGFLDIARLLIEHGADVNVEGGGYDPALCAASENGFINVARLLIEHGANVNAEGGEYGSALCAASGNGHLEAVRLLLKHNANVNAKGEAYASALYAASENGHLEVARLLLEHNADVNAEGGEYGYALHTASVNGHLDVARLLIENGADLDAKNDKYGSALEVASKHRRREVVSLLIKHGAKRRRFWPWRK